VLVASKGDEELLSLLGPGAMHFPCDAQGRYIGHYPASDEAAVSAIEEAVGRGAEFLLFPASARWWLDHYRGMATHLHSRYSALEHDDAAACIVFDLRTDLRTPPAPAAPLRAEAMEEFNREGRL
jgi:hypothetical protein